MELEFTDSRLANSYGLQINLLILLAINELPFRLRNQSAAAANSMIGPATDISESFGSSMLELDELLEES
jgi:hypothetical protein